jgi:hypothetical protein|tara:strand:+ start:396 stop:725 length:330 start_codon:yes stop_codon:yes gene_type:complete
MLGEPSLVIEEAFMGDRLLVYDPVADTATTEGKQLRPVETLRAGRMGLVYSGHGSTEKFWPVFEETLQAMYEPKETHKLYKHSTWNPAPMEDMEELAAKVDYAIIGVGA